MPAKPIHTNILMDHYACHYACILIFMLKPNSFKKAKKLVTDVGKKHKNINVKQFKTCCYTYIIFTYTFQTSLLICLFVTFQAKRNDNFCCKVNILKF